LPLERSGRLVKGRQKVVTDGPFAETKDVVGGFTLIEAGDLDQAVELSKGCPIFETDGAVEVRPVMILPSLAVRAPRRAPKVRSAQRSHSMGRDDRSETQQRRSRPAPGSLSCVNESAPRRSSQDIRPLSDSRTS